MLTASRTSSSPAFALDWLGEVLLNWGFLRTGLQRRSAEELSDHLRRDLGLLPRSEHPRDLRDPRW